MPRNSNQQYSIPAGTLGEPSTKISSSKYNAFVQDIEADLNAVRPISMVGTGITIYKETRSALYSDLDYEESVPAVVYGDSDKSYRGVYTKNGASGAGSWSQVISYLPGYQDATAVATAIGGTANAITATISGYPDPDEAKMLILVPSATNTDTAVTVNINGAGSVAIKNAAGNALAIGDLVADVGTVLFKDPDNIWRQLVSSRESATLDYQGAWSGLTTYTSAQFVMSGSTLYYLDGASSLNDDPASGAPWIVVFDFGAINLQAASNLSDVGSASASRANLGLEIGADVQAYASVLDATTASFTASNQSKLAGIEGGATADQTNAQIKTAYLANSDTNQLTDELLAAIGAGGGWDLIGSTELTADVSAVAFTGLAGYARARISFILQASADAGTKTIEVRATAGTWREVAQFDNATSANDVLVGCCDIFNLDGSEVSNLVYGVMQVGTPSALQLDRSSGNASQASQLGGVGYTSFAETIDEIRIVTTVGTFEGSTSDQRGVVTVRAQ